MMELLWSGMALLGCQCEQVRSWQIQDKVSVSPGWSFGECSGTGRKHDRLAGIFTVVLYWWARSWGEHNYCGLVVKCINIFKVLSIYDDGLLGVESSVLHIFSHMQYCSNVAKLNQFETANF